MRNGVGVGVGIFGAGLRKELIRVKEVVRSHYPHYLGSTPRLPVARIAHDDLLWGGVAEDCQHIGLLIAA